MPWLYSTEYGIYHNIYADKKVGIMTLYFDYQATTPTDERVVNAMQPFWCHYSGNPHATNHSFGIKAETAVETARQQIADLIGCHHAEITFTSGATEANNMALCGPMPRMIAKGGNHIITSCIEHKSILSTCEYLEKNGAKITYIPTNTNGIINPEDIKNAICDETALVSTMAVNNEIGTIQPIAEIGQICQEHHVIFHTDAAQAIGKIPFNVMEANADMVSISAHKMYGPKGVGALYIRRSARIQIEPLIHGGTQEKGLRAGTLPTPLCVGFGEACRIAKKEMQDENKRLLNLRNTLLTTLKAKIGDIHVNGDLDKRISGNLNIYIENVDVSKLSKALKDKIAVSFGSACSSGRYETSHVLKAIHATHNNGIRIGLGRFTTEEDINNAANILIDAVQHLRHQSIAS
jgi:cysteine desulfurase